MARAHYPYDITLNGVGYKARLLGGKFDLAQNAADLQRQDQAVEWATFEGGGGYAHADPTNPRNVCHYGKHVTYRTGVPLPGPLLQVCTFTGSPAAPGSPVVNSMVDANGDVYVAAGTGLYTVSGTTITRVATFAAAITDCINYKGVLVVAMGDSANVAASDGTGFTVSGALRLFQLGQVYWETTAEGGTRGQYLGGTEGSATTRASLAFSLDVPTHFRYHSSEGTPAAIRTALLNTANWTPNPGMTLPIGNSAFPIRSIASGPRDFRFGKPEGIYSLDQYGRPPRHMDFSRNIDLTYNGAAAFVFQTYAYFGHRQGEVRLNLLDRDQHDAPQFCHPGAWLSSESGMFGPAVAHASDGAYLVTSYFDGRNSWITYEQDRQEAGRPGPGPLVHYPGELYLANEKVHHIALTSRSGEPPTMYLFSHPYNDATTIKAWRVVLSNSGNPLVDWLAAGTGFSYTGSNAYQFSDGSGGNVSNPLCHLFLPRDFWNDRLLQKVWLRFDGGGDNLAHNPTTLATIRGVEFAQRIDSATGAFTPIGVFSTTPRSTFSFTTLASVLRGYGFDARLAFIGQNTSPPIFRGMRARASIIPEKRDNRVYELALQREPELRGSGIGRRNVYADWLATNTLQNAGPFLMTDQWRKKLIVVMQSGYETGDVEETDQGMVSVARVTVSVIQELVA